MKKAIIKSVGRSIAFSKGDDMHEFKDKGLIVSEIPDHIWGELDKAALDELKSDWISGKMTDEELEKTIEGIYEEFED